MLWRRAAQKTLIILAAGGAAAIGVCAAFLVSRWASPTPVEQACYDKVSAQIHDKGRFGPTQVEDIGVDHYRVRGTYATGNHTSGRVTWTFTCTVQQSDEQWSASAALMGPKITFD